MIITGGVQIIHIISTGGVQIPGSTYYIVYRPEIWPEPNLAGFGKMVGFRICRSRSWNSVQPYEECSSVCVSVRPSVCFSVCIRTVVDPSCDAIFIWFWCASYCSSIVVFSFIVVYAAAAALSLCQTYTRILHLCFFVFNPLWQNAGRIKGCMVQKHIACNLWEVKPCCRRETARCCGKFWSIQSLQAVVCFVWYFQSSVGMTAMIEYNTKVNEFHKALLQKPSNLA